MLVRSRQIVSQLAQASLSELVGHVLYSVHLDCWPMDIF